MPANVVQGLVVPRQICMCVTNAEVVNYCCKAHALETDTEASTPRLPRGSEGGVDGRRYGTNARDSLVLNM